MYIAGGVFPVINGLGVLVVMVVEVALGFDSIEVRVEEESGVAIIEVLVLCVVGLERLELNE